MQHFETTISLHFADFCCQTEKNARLLDSTVEAARFTRSNFRSKQAVFFVLSYTFGANLQMDPSGFFSDIENRRDNCCFVNFLSIHLALVDSARCINRKSRHILGGSRKVAKEETKLMIPPIKKRSTGHLFH